MLSGRRSRSPGRPCARAGPTATIRRRVGTAAKFGSRNSSYSASRIDSDVSRPTRSRRANGPIGKLHPPRMAVSMSSMDAVPLSSIRTALLRYGKRRALTTKPARSATTTGSLSQVRAKVRSASTVSSLAVSGRTISTRRMSGAGLKKWRPQTRSGRCVCTARSTTGKVEVLVAKMASGCTICSSSAKSAFLTCRSSTTDSITRSHSTSAPRWSVAAIRAEHLVARRGRRACPSPPGGSRLAVRSVSMASAAARVRDRTMTSQPGLRCHLRQARAHDPRAEDAHPLDAGASHGHMLPIGRVAGKRCRPGHGPRPGSVTDDRAAALPSGHRRPSGRNLGDTRYASPTVAPDRLPDRLLALEAVHNFRDLGGYATTDGRVTRWHTLFRADGLHRLSPADVESLRTLGLRTVIDLRTDRELAERGRFPVERLPGVVPPPARHRRHLGPPAPG